jgi:hypothetical protein
MIQEGLQGVWKQVHPQALRRDLEAYLPAYENSPQTEALLPY